MQSSAHFLAQQLSTEIQFMWWGLISFITFATILSDTDATDLEV